MMARLDLTLIMLYGAAVAVGLVMVASASAAMGGGFVIRHTAYLLCALLFALPLLAVPLRVWETLYPSAWLLAVLLCVLVLIPGIGHEVNGATRWIRFGGQSVQVSEFVKPCLLVFISGFLARHALALPNHPSLLWLPLVLFGVCAALLLNQPDFGALVVLGMMMLGLLFVAGVRLRYFLLLVLGAVALLGALAVLQPYRLERLVSFTDPWSVAFGSGYQLTQALIAFGRGEWFGLGLGEGIQKQFYLPEAHNDFIFAVIAEELGVAGVLGVLMLLLLLTLRLFGIGRRSIALGQRFGGYLAYGTGFLIGGQTLINLGVNTGVLPTKGLTLPFISFGGNSLLVCSLMVALSLRARIEQETQR
jgi:cell division protein FtsW